MRKTLPVYIFVLLLPLLAHPENNAMKSTVQLQSQVDALGVKVARDEIGKVEILQMSAETLTRTRITPEMLWKQFDYKLTIRDTRNSTYRNKIAEAIKSITVQQTNEDPDLRWGVLFYDLNEKCVGAIYFDKTGSKGIVGDVQASFSGNLFKWLDDNFSSVFK